MRFICLGILLLCFSCSRSRDDLWQDTKTSGRYLGTSFRALGGKNPESRQVPSREAFARGGEEDFISLVDEDVYQQIMLGDAHALEAIDGDTPIPQSRVAPGEGPIPGIAGFWSPDQGEVAKIFQHIHFDTDSYALSQSEDSRAVKAIAHYLKTHPEVYVFIEGHCDERGPAAYNLALGSRRSNSVRNQLIKEGVDLDHLLTVSYGKERPSVMGHDKSAWHENRRAEFKLYKKKG